MPTAVAAGDPMQTEYFLQALLVAANVRVYTLPFHRTDVRRVVAPRLRRKKELDGVQLQRFIRGAPIAHRSADRDAGGLHA